MLQNYIHKAIHTMYISLKTRRHSSLHKLKETVTFIKKVTACLHKICCIYIGNQTLNMIDKINTSGCSIAVCHILQSVTANKVDFIENFNNITADNNCVFWAYLVMVSTICSFVSFYFVVLCGRLSWLLPSFEHTLTTYHMAVIKIL